MALTFLLSDFPNRSITYGPAFGGRGNFAIYLLVADDGTTWFSVNFGANWRNETLAMGALPGGTYITTYNTVSQKFITINHNDGTTYSSTFPFPPARWVQGETLNVGLNEVLYCVLGTTYFISQDPDTGANILSASTDDGASWTPLQFADGTDSSTFHAYATNGINQHVLVGDDVTFFSPDGINWQSETIPSGSYNTVSWANGLFIAGAIGEQTFTSTDGINWFRGEAIFSTYSASTLDTFCFGGPFGETSGVVSGDGTGKGPFVSDVFPAWPVRPIAINSSPVNFVSCCSDDSTTSIRYTAIPPPIVIDSVVVNVTSVTITWSGGWGTEVIIEYSESSVISTGSTAVSGSYTITGLQPNTDYEFSIYNYAEYLAYGSFTTGSGISFGLGWLFAP